MSSLFQVWGYSSVSVQSPHSVGIELTIVLLIYSDSPAAYRGQNALSKTRCDLKAKNIPRGDLNRRLFRPWDPHLELQLEGVGSQSLIQLTIPSVTPKRLRRQHSLCVDLNYEK